MAGVATNGSGVGRSLEGVSSGQQQQRFQTGEALAEWRSLEQVENGSPSTSPPYWDCDDDDDDGGPKPSDLYGKYTWKIDKFSQLNKRELRSNAFEVGGYKWYILIYPQGCDVCNHLSLFLCVSHHDKLLPGWSHFAQFTIAVVNKDPKKSKYSDTLHRFWKKEHDWGWKKFMELSKVLDGFVDSDTLIIKAQVQVIRERVDRPFRCLDCQYRRELVRVYLTNVEQICRRFVEERRGKLVKLIEDKARWSSFRAFWVAMDHSSRRRMSREKTESILKVVVKHFFIEKEVTSTLVMDSLYSGLKALEGQNNKGKKSKVKCLEAEELPVPIVCIEKDTFALVDDVLLLLERAAIEPLPPKDEKGPQNRTKDGSAGEEFNKDSIERDERRLTELGRRTVEIFVLAHIFSKIEVAYQEAVALKKQEELIREEEAAWLAELEQKARRGSTDKEKKSKKKQGKQKKNNRKGKDKGRDEKAIIAAQDKIDEDVIAKRKSELVADPEPEIVLENSEAVEDTSDVSDSIDCAPEILIPDSEDRDLSLVNWDTETSELHPPIEAGSSGLSGLQNGMERRSTSVVDDSSSTCSSDSFPPIVESVANKGKSRYHRNQNSPSRGANHQSKLISEPANLVKEVPIQPAVLDARRSNDASRSSNAVGSHAHPRVVNGAGQHAGKKEVEAGSFHRNNSNVKAANNSNVKAAVDVLVPLMTQTKLKPKIISPSDPAIVSRPSADIPSQAVNFSSVLSSSSAQSSATLKPVAEPQKFTTTKPKEMPVTADKSSIPSMPVMSRPLSAPLVPGPRPTVSMVSMVQTAPVLARSVSAAGRLGPEPTTVFTNQSFVPQSYRNAIIGGPVAGSSSAYSSLVNASSHLYSQAPHSLASAQLFSPRISDRADHNPIQPNLSFGMVNHRETLQNGPVWIEHPNNMQGYDLYNPVRSRQPDHLPSEVRPLPSGRQSHQLPEEFPHLDIINDLLDDEHGIGMAARVNSGYQDFGNAPHNLNRHYSFPGDPAMSGGLGPSCRFDGARSYHDEGIHHGYGGGLGRTYDTVRDMIPTQVGPGPYLNGHIDGFMPNQWPIGGSDVPYMSVRNVDNEGGYTYPLPEYSNITGAGINGYTVYGPSNGY